MILSEDTKLNGLNGDMENFEILIYEIKEAINELSAVKINDMITMLEDNGIVLELDADGTRKICKKKRPDDIPN